MKRILVTGGSHAELPIIKALRDMGYYVITTGNNTDGIGHAAADLYVKGDFSDPKLVLDIAENNNVSGIVSGCNDYAYLSTAYACECMGFPGHDSYSTAMRIHHKDKFRGLLEECGLPCPKSIRLGGVDDIDNIIDHMSFPILIKPIDLTGGKGVQICNDLMQVQAAYDKAMSLTRETYVIAEEMIQGDNHGVSTLISDGKVIFAFFDNEQYYLNPYLVSGAYAPAGLSDEIKNNVINQIENISTNAGLADGLFHCQCIMTDAGIPYLIDPCRRAPGDLYIKLVEYSTGIPYSQAIARAEIGLEFSGLTDGLVRKDKCIARECVMTDREGIYNGISISQDIEAYVIDKLIWAVKGERIEDHLKYKAGIVFYEFPDVSIMENVMNDLYDKMVIKVD